MNFRDNGNKKFISTELLYDTAEDAARSAHEHGIKAVLAGGLAMRFHGSPRVTDDVDFIANGLLPACNKPLAVGGARAIINGVKVDFIVRTDKAKKLYQAALAATKRTEVLALKWLIPMKLWAGRGKDDLDIEWAVIEHPEVIKQALEIAEKYLGIQAGKDLDQMIEIAQWKASKQ